MSVYGDNSPYDKKPEDRHCSFCGEESIAYWNGAQTVEVCGHCAQSILPALMADAIVEDKTNYSQGVQFNKISMFWTFAETIFYRAALISALRGSCRKPKDAE